MPGQIIHLLDRFAGNIQAAPVVLLFSDFDGTLVDIHEHPSECFLDPAVGRILSELDVHSRIITGIISGRQIDDLRIRVGIDNIVYAGNHGLEIEGPGFVFREPIAVSIIHDLQELVNQLMQTVADFPGAWFQNKGLSFSIHYRQMHPADVPQLFEAVQNIATRFLNSREIEFRQGKKVLDICPAVNWHKGNAVTWLAQKLSPNTPEPLLIYFGDDDTDEDVFKSWPRSITVHVGNSRHTAANYRVSGPQEVHAFLSWLLKQVSNTGLRSDNR